MRAVLLALAVVAIATGGACRKDARPTDPPVANTGGTVPADAAPSDADDCVATCIQQSQMRAVSPEQIERECRDRCGEGR